MGWGLWFSLKIYFDQNLHISFLEALAFKKNLAKSDSKKKEKKISFLKIFACCSGDSVDKILQEAPGAWRGDSEWGRVFWKNQGFTGLCEQVIMYKKAGQFSELWVYLNFETHSRVGETHCLSTLSISSSLKFSAPSGRVVKK